MDPFFKKRETDYKSDTSGVVFKAAAKGTSASDFYGALLARSATPGVALPAALAAKRQDAIQLYDHITARSTMGDKKWPADLEDLRVGALHVVSIMCPGGTVEDNEFRILHLHPTTCPDEARRARAGRPSACVDCFKDEEK